MRPTYRVAGAIAAIGSWLGRYRFMLVPLDIVVPIACSGISAWRLWDGYRNGFTVEHWLSASLALLLAVALVAVRLRRYVLFIELKSASPAETPELEAEDRVHIRVSGYLAVGGNRRHVVEAKATFQTTELSEHIVMADLGRIRSRGPLQSVPGGWGWWYAFIVPVRIASILTGTQYYGLSSRPAIQVSYYPDHMMEKQSQLLLSFDSQDDCHMILQELQSSRG